MQGSLHKCTLRPASLRRKQPSSRPPSTPPIVATAPRQVRRESNGPPLQAAGGADSWPHACSSSLHIVLHSAGKFEGVTSSIAFLVMKVTKYCLLNSVLNWKRKHCIAIGLRAADLASAYEECKMAICGAVDGLLKKLCLHPKDVVGAAHMNFCLLSRSFMDGLLKKLRLHLKDVVDAVQNSFHYFLVHSSLLAHSVFVVSLLSTSSCLWSFKSSLGRAALHCA